MIPLIILVAICLVCIWFLYRWRIGRITLTSDMHVAITKIVYDDNQNRNHGITSVARLSHITGWNLRKSERTLEAMERQSIVERKLSKKDANFYYVLREDLRFEGREPDFSWHDPGYL